MSNILRTKSDVYNFKDDTTGGKATNRRQRSRTTSLTSKSTKAKSNTNAIRDDNNVSTRVRKDSKWRCDAFKSIISTATWINDIPPEDKSAIDSVLEALFCHIRDECECVNEAPTRLLIGNTYYELFLLKLRQFEKRVTHEEDKNTSCEDQIPRKSYANHVMNDIPVNKGSKFESHNMSNLVNLLNMSDMVSPLKEAITQWNYALNKGLKYKTITDESLIKLKVYYNISAAFQMFAFYNMHEYQLKAALLLDRFCRYYSTKQSEIRLSAIYYLIKTYIQLGAIGKAVSCLNSCAVNTSEKSTPETYGTSLILLAKCELDLLTGYGERAAALLKSFLLSDYLQKLTINRYYIKGLALMIASKFNGNQFSFSNSFQEFVEPIQMAVCILKRWHSFLSSPNKVNNENMVLNSGDLDPMWYRFAIINFALNAMKLSADFYMNIGMPVDAIFYYNALIKLARRHCGVIWLSKLLVIGSQFDMLCDHKYCAQTKLMNASSSLYVSPSGRPRNSVFTSDSSVSTISPDTKRAMDSSYNVKRPIKKSPYEIDPSYCDSTCDNDVCEHENFNLWDIRKKLMKPVADDHSDGGDCFVDKDLNRTSSLLKMFDSETNSTDLIELFLIKIEIEFSNLLVDENDSTYILRQLKDIYLNSIESYTCNILRLRIDDILKNDNKKSYNITNNELEKYGPSKAFKFRLFVNIAKHQLENREFEDAINTCNEMTRLSVFSYEERMIKSELLYFEAFCKFQLWQLKYDDFSDHVWLEYNNNLHESFSTSTLVSIHTPSPTQTKNKALIPKAPKQKKEYKTDEVQDYMIALKNAVYKEMKESKSITSTSKRIPLKSKSNRNNKLNFESDSILRSLSISETNTFTYDEPMANMIGIDSYVKQNPTVSGRVTRSRLASLKQIEETLDTEESTFKQNQSKLLNPKSINELSDDSFDGIEEIEGLDEVFQEKLNLNENIKVCEKFSEDSVFDLDSIIKSLHKVLELMSSHPKAKLYVLVHKLLTQIYSSHDHFNEDIVGYHFSESSNSASFRYRSLFISEKKKKFNREYKYDVQHLIFDRIDNSNSLNSIINNLPNDWRVVQISAVENGSKIPDLLVCRYQNGVKPVFLKIKSDPEKIIKHFIVQFNEIIERSNASIINKDRETFWRLRFSLDEELMILLRSVEETWFGPFRGIIFGQLLNKDYQEMCLNLKAFILEMANKENLICVNEELLYVVIESLPSLKYCEYKTAIKLLFKSPSIHLISKCYAKYEELFLSVYPIENKESIFNTFKMSAVGLILDKSLESFPFESLPSLISYNQSMFRTPSIRILSLMVEAFKSDIYANGIDEKSVYYVVNPADNLAKTEEYFKETFKSVKGWEGVIGRSPQSHELRNAFESKDVYIFFGHGAGASYYRAIPEGLDSCAIKTASLIIGCSSGKLFSEGKQLESYGTPYRFMMNGSPCYVGVLWDVTDKDIDKFSDQMLNHWFSNWKSKLSEKKELMPITKAVCMSRNVCKLKHLIGAAPVVYGLPLFTTSKSS